MKFGLLFMLYRKFVFNMLPFLNYLLKRNVYLSDVTNTFYNETQIVNNWLLVYGIKNCQPIALISMIKKITSFRE